MIAIYDFLALMPDNTGASRGEWKASPIVLAQAPISAAVSHTLITHVVNLTTSVESVYRLRVLPRRRPRWPAVVAIELEQSLRVYVPRWPRADVLV